MTQQQRLKHRKFSMDTTIWLTFNIFTSDKN